MNKIFTKPHEVSRGLMTPPATPHARECASSLSEEQRGVLQSFGVFHDLKLRFRFIFGLRCHEVVTPRINRDCTSRTVPLCLTHLRTAHFYLEEPCAEWFYAVETQTSVGRS